MLTCRNKSGKRIVEGKRQGKQAERKKVSSLGRKPGRQLSGLAPPSNRWPSGHPRPDP